MAGAEEGNANPGDGSGTDHDVLIFCLKKME